MASLCPVTHDELLVMFPSEKAFQPLCAQIRAGAASAKSNGGFESLVGSDELGEAPFVPRRFGYMVDVAFKE
jgi:hypothetical protein